MRIKNSNRNRQIDTNKRTKLRITFYQIPRTLYNEVPKPIQETEKYCAVVPKLKRYSFDNTALSLSNWKKKKGGPEGGAWKEKRIVTLMSKQAFDFINCVCFPARSPGEELTFLCT